MPLTSRTTALFCLFVVGLFLAIATVVGSSNKATSLRGANLEQGNRYVPSHDAVLCRVITVETLSVEEEGSNSSSDETLNCIPIVDQEESDLDFEITLPLDFRELYEDDIEQGKLLVSIKDAKLVDDELVLGDNLQYSVVTDHRYRHLQERHLQVKPIMTVAVVRISTSDSTPTKSAVGLRQGLFGSSVNFQKQYDACSFGQLKWQLASSGVTEVRLPNSIRSYGTSADLITAAQKSLKAGGLSKVSDLADKVIMCVPPGTGDWAASAGVNHWRAQMNNNWCTSLTGTMHELGHTMGLLHANADGLAYADRSGYMGSGYTSSTWPRKCFNGYNSWNFGWYSDYHLSMNPLTGGKLVSLATFVDKNKAASGETLVANVDNQFYLLYNKKKGFNIETEHKQDAVSITQPSASGTESHAGLTAGQEYKRSNFNGSGKTLVIKACGTRQGSNGADVMIVSIAMNGDICDSETSVVTTASRPASPTQSAEERPAAGSSRTDLLAWLLSFLQSLQRRMTFK